MYMYLRNREPSLDELLDDPVARAVMARDGCSEDAVRALVAETRQRLRTQDGEAAATPRLPWLMRPTR